MIITISGDIGSGKSTTAKLLRDRLGYQYLSTGSIQRKIAADMGLTTLELNQLTDSRPDIDEKIDSYTRALADTTDHFIVDSRLAWHFIPNSFKVFLLCDQQIAARRISEDNVRTSDEQNKDVDHLIKKIRERRESERSRFRRIYGIDFENHANYDLIIDSAYHYPDKIVGLILDGIIYYYNDREIFE